MRGVPIRISPFRMSIFAILSAASLAACGSNLPSPKSSSRAYLPNIPQIQTAVAQSVLARDRIRVTVLCPAVVPQIQGETFSCLAYTAKPRLRTLTFLVTEHGGTYVSWQQTS
jgi:hypothetical protein